MRADIVVVPEVEVPTHGGSVAGTKQRLDVSCKTGGAPLSGHDGAPFPIGCMAVCERGHRLSQTSCHAKLMACSSVIVCPAAHPASKVAASRCARAAALPLCISSR